MEVVVYVYLHFLNVSLIWRFDFFLLYEQPYLVCLVLFAYSQYTLLVKEVKDKKYYICFGVGNSQVLCGLFGFVAGGFFGFLGFFFST